MGFRSLCLQPTVTAMKPNLFVRPLLVALLLASPAVAQESATMTRIDDILGDHAKYDPVIKDLQDGVRAQDAKLVAALVNYPITVTISGKQVVIPTAADFAARYDEIITPDIAKAVVDQKYDNLFVNAQGIMFGDGQVWINGVCRDAACQQMDPKVVTIQHVAR